MEREFLKINRINCIYAVNKVLDSDFVVTKCDIPDDLFEELKDYGENKWNFFISFLIINTVSAGQLINEFNFSASTDGLYKLKDGESLKHQV